MAPSQYFPLTCHEKDVPRAVPGASLGANRPKLNFLQFLLGPIDYFLKNKNIWI